MAGASDSESFDLEGSEREGIVRGKGRAQAGVRVREVQERRFWTGRGKEGRRV